MIRDIENRLAIEKAFELGKIAGATEERERGKRFAEWISTWVHTTEEKKRYIDNKEYSIDELFNIFLEEENNLTN